MAANLIHPYLFSHLTVPKPWAGPRLAELCSTSGTPIPQKIGEIISIAENSDFSLEITNGPAAGQTLAKLEEAVGAEALYGTHHSLPLMLKLLDTAATLSVQVHPDDLFENDRLIKRGKTEAWYVLAAEDGAYIWQGIQANINDADFWQAIDEKRPEDVLNKRPVSAGDCIEAPAGVVHAIGPGLTLIELQQNSNTTYRIYDWERSGTREMHIAEAKEAIRRDLALPEIVNTNTPGITTLCENSHFTWINHRTNKAFSLETPSLRVLTLVSGQVTVTWPEENLRLNPLQSLLIPYACQDIRVEPEGECHLLEARA